MRIVLAVLALTSVAHADVAVEPHFGAGSEATAEGETLVRVVAVAGVTATLQPHDSESGVGIAIDRSLRYGDDESTIATIAYEHRNRDGRIGIGAGVRWTSATARSGCADPGSRAEPCAVSVESSRVGIELVRFDMRYSFWQREHVGVGGGFTFWLGCSSGPSGCADTIRGGLTFGFGVDLR